MDQITKGVKRTVRASINGVEQSSSVKIKERELEGIFIFLMLTFVSYKEGEDQIQSKRFYDFGHYTLSTWN